MSSLRDELLSKVDTLHAALNQIYALDSNWRNSGGWPSDVEGSTLHGGASSETIAEAESRFGHEFPPSYKEFLKSHCSWEHFWGDFTLIGTGPPETQDAQDEIDENMEYQTSRLRRKLGDDFSAAAVATWESEEERHLYLANHLVIGTNFSGAHWVYDTRTRRKDGELTLVHWDISYGAQEPSFSTFYEFLEWALSVVVERLEWTKQEVAKAKKEQND
ncbi:MAG: SMI1/KNR4 family protein [Planctomycetes bacterium]|nr:SMI1/KNR4 family protein [Planctomycetota bacterium]MBL7041990.1 SMI1/KNR4 family protein [Pirellulaceae bacterium]